MELPPPNFYKKNKEEAVKLKIHVYVNLPLSDFWDFGKQHVFS